MLLSFIATTWLLAMLPGVGQALMLRQTLTNGPRAAMATILGVLTGLILWTVAAGVGLAALMLADPDVYRALLLVGGAVLAVIGARTFARAVRVQGDTNLEAATTSVTGRRAAYFAGLATNLGNPKAGVFAITLLPAFAGAAAGQFLPTLGLGLVWSAVTACWYLLFVWLVSRGRAFVTRPGAQRALGCISGVVLVAVGTGMALGL